MTQLLNGDIKITSYTDKPLRAPASGLQLVRSNTVEKNQVTALERENSELRKLIINGGRPDGFIGNSSVMCDLYQRIILNASGNKNVLLFGEPGTETELVAQALYAHNGEPERQFLHFHIEPTKHKIGDKSHSHNQFLSYREIIDQYDCPLTLYFSNLAEIDSLIVKDLLRLIDTPSEGCAENKPRIQIIGAIKNLDIKKNGLSAPKKELLSVLYSNLIIVPPLRTRGADILLLTHHFFRKYCVIHKKEHKSLSPAAADFLLSYRWPGNVKELEIVVENSVKCSQHHIISIYDLYTSVNQKQTWAKGGLDLSFDERISLYEKELIINALRKANGNQAKAAIILKITKRILQYKIEKYAIEYKKFKVPSVNMRQYIGMSEE